MFANIMLCIGNNASPIEDRIAAAHQYPDILKEAVSPTHEDYLKVNNTDPAPSVSIYDELPQTNIQ